MGNCTSTDQTKTSLPVTTPKQHQGSSPKSKLRHTGPNPLIKSAIDSFFERLTVHEANNVIASAEAEKQIFGPAFEIIKKMLNNIHHHRLAVDTSISELEESSVTHFVASIEASLSHPFLSTTTAFRLCLRQLNVPGIHASNAEEDSQSASVGIEAALLDRTTKAVAEKLACYKKFDKDFDDAFDVVDNAFANGKVVEGVKLVVETASEIPVVGQFIKPLMVIGKFCYERAKSLHKQREDAKELLKLVAKQVDRIARMDQLAGLLLIDDEMKRSQEDDDCGERNKLPLSPAAGSPSSAAALAALLASHKSNVEKETSFKISQSVLNAQLMIARCFDTALPFDDVKNKWYQEISNFFTANDKSQLFPALKERLVERMDALVTLIKDQLNIANTSRLIRLEKLLLRLVGENNTVDGLSHEQKASLVLALQKSLRYHYRAAHQLTSSAPKRSYGIDDVYVAPTLHADSSSSSFAAKVTPETLLSNTPIDRSCIVICASSGHGKTIALKQMAACQNDTALLRDNRSNANKNADNNNNNNTHAVDDNDTNDSRSGDDEASSAPFPGIVIYMDLESFMEKVYKNHDHISEIDSLLDCALQDLAFSGTNKPFAISKLKAIIVNNNVPVTWLIDGYEEVAAKKELGRDTGTTKKIYDFFTLFANALSRNDALSRKTSPKLVRSCDRVVVAVRPEFLNDIVPRDTDFEDNAVALYRFDPLTEYSISSLSRNLFSFLPAKKLDAATIDSKIDSVFKVTAKNEEVTPRFVNILCQCYLSSNDDFRTAFDSSSVVQLVDVFEKFINTSYKNATAILPSTVPDEELRNAGTFALGQFQQGGRTLYLDPSQNSEKWVLNFQKAGLITTSTADSKKMIMFGNNPEFGELLAIFYLSKFPNCVSGDELQWNVRSSNIWLTVAKHIFHKQNIVNSSNSNNSSSNSNNSGETQKFIEAVAKKYFDFYCILRLQVEATILKRIQADHQSDEQSSDFVIATSASSSPIELRTFSIARTLLKTASDNDLTNNNKSTALLIQQSLNNVFFDSTRFPAFYEVCHGDLLLDLFDCMGSQNSIKILSSLCSKHKSRFGETDCRKGFPPFLLWLVGPLGRLGDAAVAIIKFIDAEFLDFAKYPFHGGSGKPKEAAARLDEYKPSSAFGVEVAGPSSDKFLVKLTQARITLLSRIQLQRLLDDIDEDSHNNISSSSSNNFIESLLASSFPASLTAPSPSFLEIEPEAACNLFNRTLVVYFENKGTPGEIDLIIELKKNEKNNNNNNNNNEPTSPKQQQQQHETLIQFLIDKKVKFTFLEVIRYSSKSSTVNVKSLEVALREERKSISEDDYNKGMLLARKKKSAALISCLLKNAKGSKYRQTISLRTVNSLVQAVAMLDARTPPASSTLPSTVCNLRIVDLSDLPLKFSWVDNIAHLCKSIRYLPTLQRLRLANNKIDLGGVCVLAKELFTTASRTDEDDKVVLPNLEALDLSANKFGVSGFWVIGSAIYKHNEWVKEALANNKHTNKRQQAHDSSSSSFSIKPVFTDLLLRGIQIGEDDKAMRKGEPPCFAAIRKCCERDQHFTANHLSQFIGNDLPRQINKLTLCSTEDPQHTNMLTLTQYSSSIVEVLRRVALNQNIIHLNLTGSRIGAQALLSVFKESTYLKNVKNMFLDGCALNEGGAALFSFLATQNMPLEKLDLGSNDFKSSSSSSSASSSSSSSSSATTSDLCESISRFLHSCSSSLKVLFFANNKELGTDIVSKILLAVFPPPPATSLSSAEEKAPVSVISGMENLMQLDLSQNKFESSGKSTLDFCLKLPPKVAMVNLSNVGIWFQNNSQREQWNEHFILPRRNVLKQLDISGNIMTMVVTHEFQNHSNVVC